jgi:hypothetical protein
MVLSAVLTNFFLFCFSLDVSGVSKNYAVYTYVGYNYPTTVFVDCWILKMEAEFFSERLVDFFRILES